jgi:photosynthetic reaction center H subunit
MRKDEHQRIARLKDLDDYEVADHDPDIRGWDVLSADGRKIGEVDDLYVDPGAMKVRYLNVELDDEFRTGGSDRHVIVPVGRAQLHESDDNVVVEGLEAGRVTAMPTYGGQLDRAYEDSVRTYFGSRATATGDVDYYGDRDFDDERLYASRRRAGGGTADQR